MIKMCFGLRILFGRATSRFSTGSRIRSIGDDITADAIEEEFFWHVDASVSYLRKLDLSVETTRFSALSWGTKIYRSRVASA